MQMKRDPLPLLLHLLADMMAHDLNLIVFYVLKKDLFYVYEYTIVLLRHTRRGHQISHETPSLQPWDSFSNFGF